MRVLILCSLASTLSWSGVALAQPDPSNCLIPDHIDLVGMRDGVLDPGGEFSVVVRDANGIKIVGTPVRLVFTRCTDLRPSAIQPYPGLSVACEGDVVSAVTDSDGFAHFKILGSAWRREPASTTNCIEVRADPGNVLIGATSAAVYDLDGIDGVNPNDLALVQCEVLQFPLKPRIDYGHNQSGAQALLLSQNKYWAGTSAETGPRCDGQPTRSPTSSAASFRLSWSECRTGGGANSLGFACNTNTGTVAPLLCSFVPHEDLGALKAFEATIDLIGEPGSPLPPWWQFQSGGCRSTSLVAAIAPITACESPFESNGTLSRRIEYPFGAPNIARIRLVAFMQEPVGVVANAEYNLFQLTINRARTVPTLLNPDVCEGCSSPVTFKLRSVRLIQAGGCDQPSGAGAPYTAFVMGPPDALGHVIAQGPVTGVDEPRTGGDLALRPAGATPSSGGVSVAFTLPVGGSARFEIIDVSGRNVVVKELAALGAGHHTRVLAEPGTLRPGVYLVRLLQGRASASLKWVVLP